MTDAATIVAIKDKDGYLHAPFDDEGDGTVCGLSGERIDFPATYTGRWCSTCMYDCVSTDGVRLWPVVAERSRP